MGGCCGLSPDPEILKDRTMVILFIMIAIVTFILLIMTGTIGDIGDAFSNLISP